MCTYAHQCTLLLGDVAMLGHADAFVDSPEPNGLPTRIVPSRVRKLTGSAARSSRNLRVSIWSVSYAENVEEESGRAGSEARIAVGLATRALRQFPASAAHGGE